MFKNRSLFARSNVGFTTLMLILFGTGAIGYFGMTSVNRDLQTITESTPLLHAVTNITAAVSQEIRLTMKLVTSNHEEELNSVRQEHRNQVAIFDRYIEAILRGEKPKEGMTIYPTTDPELRAIAEDSKQFHNTNLQPLVVQVFELKKQELAANNQMAKIEQNIDKDYARLIRGAEDLERNVKKRIKDRRRARVSSTSILRRETTWTDMAMEIKTTVSQSINELRLLAKIADSATIQKTNANLSEKNREFNLWVSALLKGGNTPEGRIVRVNVQKLRNSVASLRKLHNESFYPQIKTYIKLSGKIHDIKEKQHVINQKMDKASEQITKQLEKIEALVNDEVLKSEVAAQQRTSRSIYLLFAITAVGVLVSSLMAFAIRKTMIKPISRSALFAESVANGDLSETLSCGQQDEIGLLAGSLNKMVGNLSGVIRNIHNSISTLAVTTSELRNIAKVTAKGTENTSEKVNTVAAASEEMHANIDSVAATMEQATTNVNNIVAAVEEMNVNFKDITDRISQTRESTNQAAELSEISSKQVNELGKAANEIEAITDAILSISDKTSLLALNATIEAARAGDAGKGFAVVAKEIKALALQTAESTSEIDAKLKAIQEGTKMSISGMEDITEIIVQVNDSVDSITRSMQQQNEATREIAENISQTSIGVTEINENIVQTSQAVGQIANEIVEVNRSANDMNSSSQQIEDSVTNLVTLSDKLDQQVSEFKLGDQGFSAGKVKMDHSAWKEKLADLLSGRSSMQVSDISSHTECEFGKWYFDAGTKLFGELAVFREIDAKHKIIHEAAKEITGLYNDGRMEEANKRFNRFNNDTNELFSLLDQLEDETKK